MVVLGLDKDLRIGPRVEGRKVSKGAVTNIG